jgi:hypothetical protein
MAGFGFGNYLSPQVGSFIDSRRNALAGLGAGLLNGQPGAGVQAGLQADDAYATQQKAEAERQKAIADQQAMRARYADFFTKQGKPDIAKGIADGILDPGEEYIKAITPKAPIKASEGDVFLDPTTYQPVGGVPPKPTSAIQEYNYAVSQGYTGSFQQYETDMKKAGATNIDFNANQGNAAGFADRMTSANAIISDPKIEAAMTDLVKKGTSGVPVFGNFLVGAEFQQAEQAKRDFVNAILRRESGAVISPSEFENANQQYFPQPGDSPEVIAQKAANRQIAIEGVQRAAGPNYAAPLLTPPGVSTPQMTSTGVPWSIEP